MTRLDHRREEGNVNFRSAEIMHGEYFIAHTDIYSIKEIEFSGSHVIPPPLLIINDRT